MKFDYQRRLQILFVLTFCLLISLADECPVSHDGPNAIAYGFPALQVLPVKQLDPFGGRHARSC